MAESTGTSYSTDPALYIYTSLTAGSSHIVTATSRLETILRANRVPFKALDIATDEKARMLWGRRAGKDENGRVRKLPALIQMGLVLGDLVEIEEWNEYGELKQHVTIYYDDNTIPSKNAAPPPVAMRPLNQPFPRSGIAPSASPASSTAATPAAAKTTAGAPPPPAPPLPTSKDKTKIPLSSPAPTSTTKKNVNSAASAATPHRNIAEEAAKKAKTAQLNRVQGKAQGKDSKENEKPATAGPAPVATASKKSTSEIASATKSMGNLALGSDGATNSVPQSSTAGARKVDGTNAKVTEHRGAPVVSAPAAQVAAMEKASAIPEAEEEDSEESDEDDEGDEDDEEDEDEEDEDDSDKGNDGKEEEDSEEESSEEEDSSEDEATKPKAKN
ncbi:putative thioredoxin-like fold protein [Rosellinia necatrix]|uniref:Putative thioredoxin-like fold protein n=1 Tax=Rosellinia necatrix TaxID=77044 RepID=A0A1W2TDS8_ROSNE|nr:putative thioredoxin-like fold protein [Rosellinia necatrix]